MGNLYVNNLRKNSYITIEICDAKNIRVIDGLAKNQFPSGSFSWLNLNKCLAISAKAGGFHGFAVIHCPYEWYPMEEVGGNLYEGEDDLYKIMRAIDKSLLAAGIKRRVYETIAGDSFFYVDSDEVK